MKTIITSLFVGLAMSAQATIHRISVSNFQFSPATLQVSVGDTVRFVYSSGIHTTTSSSIPVGAETWDKPMNASGQVFDYIVKVEGTYNYLCSPHASFMKGTFTATVTGVDKQSTITKQSVSMAPNPASDRTTLSFNSENAFSGSLQLINSVGKSVYSENVNVTTGMNQISLNAENLNSGIYFVNLSNQNGLVLVERLIKK